MSEKTRQPKASFSGWRAPVAIGIIIAASVLAYHNSLGGPFIFDDITTIPENSTIRSLWPIWTALSPPKGGTPVQRRPIVNLSLAVNYAIGGLDVRGYHVFNLAVHILAALTLFGVIRRTLGLSVVPEYIAAASLPLAFVAALIWTVHPLATEAVTYIIQRTELLAGLFYLLTLYCLIRGASASRSVWWNVAAVAACALGMGSKEVVVSAPLVVLVYDRLFLCRAFKEVFHRRWGLYLPLASTWALLVMLLGHGSEAAPGAVHVSVYVSRDVYWTALPTYALMQLAAIVRYLGLCFWPHPLIVDYGHLPTGTVSLNPTHAIIVLFLLAATVRAFTKQPRLAFLSLWFFAILAPSSTIIPVVGQPIAEKRMYLPLAGVVVIVVLGVYALGRRIWDRLGAPEHLREVVGQLAVLAMGVAVALALGRVTVRRNWDYRSGLAIWDDTIAKQPNNWRAWLCRGVAHGNRSSHDKAISDFNRAIELYPAYTRAFYNRAIMYEKKGRHQESIDDFGKAIELKPNYAEAYYGRAMLHLAGGDYQKARADAEKAQAMGYKFPARFLEAIGKGPGGN